MSASANAVRPELMRRALRAPFPFFGGKSKVVDVVWSRFGVVDHYIEPFFGSGAMLWGAPQIMRAETVNDKDRYVANFWRSVQADPDAVARYADWPVNEADLEARHYWLLTEGATRIAAVIGDPEGFDAQVAGWWVWGLCAWIGDGWCSGVGPWTWGDGGWTKSAGRGGGERKRFHLATIGKGIHRQLPNVSDLGSGLLSHNGGSRREAIVGWIAGLSVRLHDVRVVCGDWTRVTGPSVTTRHGISGVFLDPPYASARAMTYAEDDAGIAAAVRAWCAEAGGNPALRIALCGYAGEHDPLKDLGWSEVAWKAGGGYGSQGAGQGRENANRERIWFSPHCLSEESRMTQASFAFGVSP